VSRRATKISLERLQADAIRTYLDETEKQFGPVPELVAAAVDAAYLDRFARLRRVEAVNKP
jgi:hypothetical protein